MPASRRGLLRTTALTATAVIGGCAALRGCVHTALFELLPATPETVTDRLADPARRLGPFGRELARAAIDEGSVEYTACDRLFDDGVYVIDSAYYRLRTAETSSVETTGYEVEVEFLDTERTRPAENQVVDYEDLPEPDRQALAYGVLNDLRKEVSKAELAGITSNTSICYPSETALNSSNLVSSPRAEFVDYEGTVIAITVEEPFETSSRDFRLRADEVAASPEAFVEYAFAELLDEPVNLDERSLSDRQEAILTKAVSGQVSEEGFRTCVDEGRPSEGFKELIRLIFAGDDEFEINRGVPGVQPVVWEDERYLATYRVAVK